MLLCFAMRSYIGLILNEPRSLSMGRWDMVGMLNHCLEEWGRPRPSSALIGMMRRSLRADLGWLRSVRAHGYSRVISWT